MCPIPASEEFITDYGDSLFASLNFFVPETQYFSLNSVNCFALMWSPKKIIHHHKIANFITKFGEFGSDCRRDLQNHHSNGGKWKQSTALSLFWWLEQLLLSKHEWVSVLLWRLSVARTTLSAAATITHPRQSRMEVNSLHLKVAPVIRGLNPNLRILNSVKHTIFHRNRWWQIHQKLPLRIKWKNFTDFGNKEIIKEK